MTKKIDKQNKENKKSKSIFGALKGKTKSFTRKEREEIIGDDRFN